jgi:hypothetical protein
MQIYELTANKKAPINEINLGAIGKAIGSAAISKAGDYVNQKTGMQLAGDDANPYAGAASKDKAMAAVASMSKAQAAQQKQLFDKALAQIVAQKGVTSAANLQQSDVKSLYQNLYQQIHKNLLQNKLTDYTKLPSYIKTGQPQQQAQQVVKTITDAMTSIQNPAMYDKANAVNLTNAWELLTKAAGEAMILLQFDSSATSAAPGTTPNINPQLQAMQKAAAANKLTAQQLGINQTAINNFQNKYPPGTDPKMDLLFKAMGLYPV